MIGKFLILINLCFIEAFDVSYDGYKVFEAVPQSKHDVILLHNITEQMKADIWTRSSLPSLPWIINLNPTKVDKFIEFLNETHIDCNIIIENLKDSIRNERYKFRANSKRKNLTFFKGDSHKGSITMDRYHDYNEIRVYMRKLAQLYPSKVQQITIGRTIEGRPIEGIKLSTGNETRKPAILVECGAHAREWITPAMCLFIMSQLMENERYRSMVDKVDWYIFPVLNPDGYWYSMTKDRMWRKNRSKNTECYGVDLNRNYHFHWREQESESDECVENYAGPEPFSELETQSLANFILEHQNEIKLYLTIHSHGAFILYPWVWTQNTFQADDLYYDIATRAAKAIERVRGTKYKVGSGSHLLYLASGVSQDWMFGFAEIPLSFTLELAAFGHEFDPPKSMIRPIVNETFEGIKVYHHFVQSTWGQHYGD